MADLCEGCALVESCEVVRQFGRCAVTTCVDYKSIEDECEKIIANPSKATMKLEKEFQSRVEDWLRLRGYYRRTPTDISQIVKAPRGWQIHLHQTKRNPILLDILLLSHDGHCTEFELKRSPIRWNGDEQRTLCEQYGNPVFTSFEAVVAHVKKWEREHEEADGRSNSDANAGGVHDSE